MVDVDVDFDVRVRRMIRWERDKQTWKVERQKLEQEIRRIRETS